MKLLNAEYWYAAYNKVSLSDSHQSQEKEQQEDHLNLPEDTHFLEIWRLRDLEIYKLETMIIRDLET